MAKLDRSRPYSEVYGVPGAAFEQDGLSFKSNGDLSEKHLKSYDDNDPYPLVEDDNIGVGVAQVVSGEAPDKIRDVVTFDDMHWRHLKVLVESYGGEYTSKTNALAFLKGQKQD